MLKFSSIPSFGYLPNVSCLRYAILEMGLETLQVSGPFVVTISAWNYSVSKESFILYTNHDIIFEKFEKKDGREIEFKYRLKWKFSNFTASLCGSVDKDLVYHACGYEFKSRLK